jgi:dsDNA-binding SOS-regulon protein
MEPPDDPKQRLSFYLAKQKEALEKAATSTDAKARRSWLNLAENYGFLAEAMRNQRL